MPGPMAKRFLSSDPTERVRNRLARFGESRLKNLQTQPEPSIADRREGEESKKAFILVPIFGQLSFLLLSDWFLVRRIFFSNRCA